MVGVAQLVEPWIVIPVVVGSSPIIHPNLHIVDFKVLTLDAFNQKKCKLWDLRLYIMLIACIIARLFKG